MLQQRQISGGGPGVRLPQLVRFNVLAANAEELPEAETPDPQYHRHLSQLAQYLQNKFVTWQVDQNFRFELPPNCFENTKQRAFVEFRKADSSLEKTEIGPLTAQQLESIRDSAEFVVTVPGQRIPYRWQINEFIYKGRRKTCDTLHRDLGFCFSMMYSLKDRITGDNFHSLRTRGWNILNYFPKLLRFFVGLPSFTQSGYPLDPVFVMEMDRHLNMYNEYWNRIDKTLLQFLRGNIENLEEEEEKRLMMELDEREQYLTKITDRMTEAWKERFEQIKEKISVILPENEFEEICERERAAVERRIAAQMGLDPRLEAHLRNLLMEQQIIREVVNEFRERTLRSQKVLRDEMEEFYYIRRHSKSWFEEHYNENVELVRRQNREHMLEKLRSKLHSPHFNCYLRMMADYEERSQSYKEDAALYRPSRIFSIKYKLFPPYRVECREDHYQLVREEFLEVPTSFCGWKLVLFSTRYYCWTKNFMYWAFRNMWVGKLGLRILFGCRKFYPVYMVNADTGELGEYNGIERTPIAFQVAETCESIFLARREFEEAPDTGLFSKVCSRLYNLFFLYILVLLGYVVGYLLILKPVLIFLNLVVTLLLFCTAFVWMPIILLLYWLFTLFIYNCDHDYNKDAHNECSQTWLPLISSTAKLLLDVVIFFLTILLIVVAPIFAVAFAMLGLLRFLVRRIYDTIAFFFIKCCARAPIGDTWMAWKVAGPGVSRSYYQTIHEADFYVLVVAELEKLKLEVFEQEMVERLNEPYKQATQLASQFARELNTFPTFIESLQPPIYYYINLLHSQVEEAKRHFPELPGENIRFTQSEMDLLTANTKHIIKQFLNRHPGLSILAALKIKSKRLDKAVVALWERIFEGPGVFEVLENIDERLEVGKTQDTHFKKVISNIQRDFHILPRSKIEQEREDTHFVYVPVQKGKPEDDSSDNDINYKRVSYREVIRWVKASSGEILPDSKTSPEYSILPNINILALYDRSKGKIKLSGGRGGCC